MGIYFDFRTINELTGDNYDRQQREFTLEDLAKYNGKNGNPAYVAIEGIVYDISNSTAWVGGTHSGLTAGQDLTNQFNSCHGIMDILNNAPKVGTLIDNEYMSDMDYMNNTNNMDYMNNMNNMNFKYTMPTKRQVSQDKSKFTPDDWIRYVAPLVVYALRETNQGTNVQGTNAQRSFQKIILSGVLVGLGKTPQEAINQVQQWQNTGESQILKSGTGGTTSTGGGISTGDGTGTFGGMGTGGTTGTGFGTGAGTTSTGGGISTGSGTGTFGGMGTGGTTGTGFGTGAGTGGTTSTGGGISPGGGTGSFGGLGTGGTTGTGFGTGAGTGGTTSTGGGISTGGGTGTSGTTGTGSSSEVNKSNRLQID